MALEATHYHVGIVVEDLESAAAQLTDLLGVTWGSISEVGQMTVRRPDGNDHVVPLRCVYSTEAPRLELIEEVPGSIWVRNEHSNLHHLGVWAEGLAGESDRLAGMQPEGEVLTTRWNGQLARMSGADLVGTVLHRGRSQNALFCRGTAIDRNHLAGDEAARR